MEETELIRRFLEIQQRRAAIYSELQRGFTEYQKTKSEIAYKELCSKVTTEFSDCSRQVIEIESALREPPCNREDLANLLHAVQSHEKTKLQMTATLQILKRAGHPNERETNHDMHMSSVVCSLSCSDDISGLEECQAEAEYLAAHKETVTSLQHSVESINELMETVRCEFDGDEL